MKRTEPLIGAHMSIAGGVDGAIPRGESVGCRTIQIFTKNASQWVAKKIDEDEAQRFKENLSSSKIESVVVHDSYLINLASPKEDLRKKSFAAFLDEMERCRQLGIEHLIMHPGSHTGSGEEDGLKTITSEFNEILSRTEGWKVNITIETTAGQGTNLGYRFEQIAAIIDGVKEKERMKVCFDTCHTFAAGYDISTEEGYLTTMEEFNRLIGLDRLIAFHINDSKKGLGCRVDRHEQLGEGTLGETVFRMIMNDPRFEDVPKILETPKGKEMEEDRINLAFLKGLVT